MFSCLNCRKALIAKSKSHSEISYDKRKYHDEQEHQQLTADDLSDHADDHQNKSSVVTSQSASSSAVDSSGIAGLRRSQTQVRGKGFISVTIEDEKCLEA